VIQYKKCLPGLQVGSKGFSLRRWAWWRERRDRWETRWSPTTEAAETTSSETSFEGVSPRHPTKGNLERGLKWPVCNIVFHTWQKKFNRILFTLFIKTIWRLKLDELINTDLYNTLGTKNLISTITIDVSIITNELCLLCFFKQGLFPRGE
jgi:hypothetical protein